MRRALAVLLIVSLGGAARADTHAEVHRREVHGAITLAGAAAYLIVEIGLKSKLAPAHCHWCDPPGLDVSVRNALRWNDTGAANTWSNITGFYTAPVVALGLLGLAEGSDRSVGRWIDDGLPVAESAVAAALLHHMVKFLVGRQRPFVHYAAPGSRTPNDDDNMSFFSGHTAATFSIAAAAGYVAHERHYRLEPEIWAAGFALAATTGYLRMAADKHYFTDVCTGALVGTAVGLAVPRLFDHYLSERPVTVVPTGTTLTLAGTF